VNRLALALEPFTRAIVDLPPETIALSTAAGLVCGIFPMWGVPTLLCVLAALFPRISLPALMAVNHLSSPLQLALFLPFSRVGALVFGSHGALPLQAVQGWFCVCVPLGIPLYFALACILRSRAAGHFTLWRWRAGGTTGALRLASERILSSRLGIS
jgi:Uncharacterized protein conserved in bacteria (DUF2062)